MEGVKSIGMGRGGLRPQRDGAVVAHQGFVELPGILKKPGEVIPGARLVGIRGQGLPQGGDRLVEHRGVAQNRPQVISR